MGPDLLFGLDGGGTKTLLAVADRDGAVLHLSAHPALDPFSDPAWADTLAAAVAGVRLRQARIAGAVLGLSCHGEVTDASARQVAVAQTLLGARAVVINDVEAAFDGALAGAPGVLLLAGTGSMAWARDGTRTMRCGGWGPVIGDEGSAYAIGRDALGRASRALDGRTADRAFADRLLEAIGIAPDDLIAWSLVTDGGRAAVAALASAVDALAAEGDAVARTILMDAADALAAHAFACARSLSLPSPLAWSYAGGVFRSATVLERVAERLGAAPRTPRLPPVGGALLHAARRAGWPITDGWIERLDASLSTNQRSAEAA